MRKVEFGFSKSIFKITHLYFWLWTQLNVQEGNDEGEEMIFI